MIFHTFRLVFQNIFHSLKNPKPILETRNRINGTGNIIIFPTYRPLIKKLLSQNIFPFNLWSPKLVLERGYRIIETGNGIICPTY